MSSSSSFSHRGSSSGPFPNHHRTAQAVAHACAVSGRGAEEELRRGGPSSSSRGGGGGAQRQRTI